MRSAPLSLVEKGVHHEIEVNLKALLGTTVSMLGGKAVPEFSEVGGGGNGVKYATKFEIMEALNSRVVAVEGMESPTVDAAQCSAAKAAFDFISEDCSIRVCDFSTRVAMSFAAYNTASGVVEAIELVKKMVDSLDVALFKCRQFAAELETKAMRESISTSIVDTEQVYMELSRYMSSMVKIRSTKSFAARKELKKLESEKLRNDELHAESRKKLASKGYAKNLVIPAKAFLVYVLGHLGLPKPSYTSSLHRTGLVKAVVKFFVPYMDHLKLCGFITAKAKAESTAAAEDHAAYEALCLVEKNLNVKIHDLNYAQRVEAEEEQRFLMDNLGKIIAVGDQVRELFEGLMESVNNKVEESTDALGGSPTDKEDTLQKVCADGVQEVAEGVSDCYSECWNLACKLKKIKCQLYGSKLKLGMISPPFNSGSSIS